MLNDVLLAGGYVQRQTDRPEDGKYKPVLERAEQDAKAHGSRLWATCGP